MSVESPASQPHSDGPRHRLTLLIRDLGFAGAQRQLVALAKGLPDNQVQTTVVSFYGGPMQSELESAGVKVICLGKKHRWDVLGFLMRTVSAIRDSKPDTLYSFLSESNMLAALMRPMLPRTRIIWGLRDSETDAALYGWLGKLVFSLGKLLSNVPDLHIANSHSGAKYYISQGYPSSRMCVVPNGIDVNRFQRDANARARIRNELGVSADETLFGIVGRLSPMKDYATFVRAAAIVNADATARFLCIGGGGDAYATQMRELAESLGLGGKIIWSAPRSDMPSVFNALDALVSSSAFGEGFSNVAGEAMACGTPCIVTDVGDSAFIVGDTGMSMPPRNPEALAQAMKRFLSLDHKEREMLGMSAQQRIRQQFTVPVMIAKTSDILMQTTSQKVSGRVQKPLFLITALGTGGAEMMLAQLLTNLDRSRFAPEVVSLMEGGKYADILRAAGIPVHALGLSAGKPSLRSMLRLRSLVRQIQPDLLIGWMYHGNLAATLASWIGKHVPVLWNVRQSLYSLAYEKRGSAMVIKLLARLGFNPSHVFYNSQISARQHETIGYPSDKTVLVPNGFNTNAFKPNRDAGRDVRTELGLPEDTILIGRFGRNSAMKDYATFLEAMKLLPHAHAIIAGTGTTELTGSANVHILGERNDLPRLTAALDIACSSSAFGEGFPNVVAEAMSSAIPCVVTDVGDSAWLLGDAGKVVPSGNAEALASALKELAAMSLADRDALGAKGRQRILDDFSLPAVVQRFEQIFESAASAHSPTPSAPPRINQRTPVAVH